MLNAPIIEALRAGRHSDPFAVLGRHAVVSGGASLAVFLPGAVAVQAEMGGEMGGDAAGPSAQVWPLQRLHAGMETEAACSSRS